MLVYQRVSDLMAKSIKLHKQQIIIIVVVVVVVQTHVVAMETNAFQLSKAML